MVKIGGSSETFSALHLSGVSSPNPRGLDLDAQHHLYDELVGLTPDEFATDAMAPGEPVDDEGSDEGPDEATASASSPSRDQGPLFSRHSRGTEVREPVLPRPLTDDELGFASLDFYGLWSETWGESWSGPPSGAWEVSEASHAHHRQLPHRLQDAPIDTFDSLPAHHQQLSNQLADSSFNPYTHNGQLSNRLPDTGFRSDGTLNDLPSRRAQVSPNRLHDTNFSSTDALDDLPAHNRLIPNGLQDNTLRSNGLLSQLRPETFESLRLADEYFAEQRFPSPPTSLFSPRRERSDRGYTQSSLHDQAAPSPQFGYYGPSYFEYQNSRNGQSAPSGFAYNPYSSSEFSPGEWNGSRSNASSRRSLPHQRNRSNIVGLSSISDPPASSSVRPTQYSGQLGYWGPSWGPSWTGLPRHPDQARRDYAGLGSANTSREGSSGNPRSSSFLPTSSAPYPWWPSVNYCPMSPIDRRRGQSLSIGSPPTDRVLRKKMHAGSIASRPLSLRLARMLSNYCRSRNQANALFFRHPNPDLSVSDPRNGSLDFVYTITLIPASFSLERVIESVDIFQKHAPYIPTLVTMKPGEPPQEHYGHFDIRYLADAPSENSSHHVDAPLGVDGKGWPVDEVPTEIFQRIAEELSWDDLLNMRCVNHEFDSKVSGFVFKAVVVPFRRQIYSAKAHDEIVHKQDLKGKGKATHDPVDDQHLHMVKHGYYSNVKDKDIYNGMEVFTAWGSDIRKFAMSFEVNEDILRHPPNKGRFETHDSFWGPYIWPSPHYARYAACETLEKKADEHQLMTIALSNLSGVYELALSVVSGLGWITGPDQSDRQKIFAKPPEVFGPRFPPSISESRSRYRKWKALTAHLEVRDTLSRGAEDVDDFGTINGRNYPPLIFDGVDHELAVPDNYDITSPHAITFSNLVPNSLTAAQQEWLLENNWAQEAFLTSWCMALVDNACTFKNVHTLKFVRLSSRYLKMLERQDIWTALENLRNVTILLVPDWRDVVKTDDRIVDTPSILPSLAANQLFGFLEQWLVGVEKLTALKIGYAAGGERARGMCARNKHVLPAPVVRFNPSRMAINDVEKVLKLPYIQHLTLTNCWIPPDVLKKFVLAHNFENAALHTLVLDSVSLTACPGVRNPDPSVPPRLVGATFTSALNRAAIANPMLRNLSPVVQLQVVQDLQLSSNGQDFDLGPDAPHDWLDYKEREGSWPDVINAITPGETLDQKRFLYGHVQEEPPPRSSSSLRRIELISCGYVRLTMLVSLDQQAIGNVESTYFSCLQQRENDLAHVMMSSEDPFLGQIVPTIDLDEYMLLNSAFGMTSGWGDDESKYENREDGQPEGGSGRINGSFVGAEENGNGN